MPSKSSIGPDRRSGASLCSPLGSSQVSFIVESITSCSHRPVTLEVLQLPQLMSRCQGWILSISTRVALQALCVAVGCALAGSVPAKRQPASSIAPLLAGKVM